jgi:hypothetical protein
MINDMIQGKVADNALDTGTSRDEDLAIVDGKEDQNTVVRGAVTDSPLIVNTPVYVGT